MPRPEYDQSCRAVRNRFGVTTTGSAGAVRMGLKPGHVSKILLIGWR